MLTRLLRSFLRPYIRQVAIVVSLLVAQTVGNLYLPNLNADIINNGVEKGNIRYIWTTGGVMLAIALAVGVRRDRGGVLGVTGGDGRRRGHPGRGVHPGAVASPPAR